MSPDEVALHLVPPPGVTPNPYPPWRDQVYRIALAAMTGALLLRGAALEAGWRDLLLPDVGILAAATLAASYFFLVWVEGWRWLVLGVSAAGIVSLPLSVDFGIGLLMAAASVMAAKETHCFHFPSGRLIPWVSLAAAPLGLFPPLRPLYGAGLLVVGLLWVPLLYARFRMRLLSVSV